MPEPINVTIALKNLEGGGAEKIMLTLAEGLADAGFQVELVLFQKQGELVNQIPQGMPVVSFEKSQARHAIVPLARYLSVRRPDVLLTTLRHTALTVALARKLARSPVTKLIIREANHLGSAKPEPALFNEKVKSALQRWAYRQANLLVAVSKDLAAEIREFIGRDAPQVVTRYNPVVTHELFEAAKQAPQHEWLSTGGRQGPVFVAAGRLVEQKDFSTLLHAFALLPRRHRSRLILFGEGRLRKELSTLAQTLGIDDCVSFPGFSHNLPAEISRASAFVLSSRWEGLPGVLIQAMALGVPVISTDCPTGPREVIMRKEWGALVPVGDAAALAHSMERVVRGELQPAPMQAVEPFRETVALQAYVEDIQALAGNA